MLERLLGAAFALLALMLVGLTLFIGLGVGSYVWDAHRSVLIAVSCCAALVAAFAFHRRPRVPGWDVAQPRSGIHPGISMHAIPIGGGIGLVFAIGYGVMFWFGAPAYRPVVLSLAVLGGLFGILLTWFRRPKSIP